MLIFLNSTHLIAVSIYSFNLLYVWILLYHFLNVLALSAFIALLFILRRFLFLSYTGSNQNCCTHLVNLLAYLLFAVVANFLREIEWNQRPAMDESGISYVISYFLASFIDIICHIYILASCPIFPLLPLNCYRILYYDHWHTWWLIPPFLFMAFVETTNFTK